jgi:hypothetical protein
VRVRNLWKQPLMSSYDLTENEMAAPARALSLLLHSGRIAFNAYTRPRLIVWFEIPLCSMVEL